MNKLLMSVAAAPLFLAAQASATTVLTVNPSSLTFYALPGATTAAENFKIKQASGYTAGSTNASVTAASGSFSGAAKTGTVGSAGLSSSYTFTGAASAGTTGETTVTTGSVSYSGSNANGAHTYTQAATKIALSGYTVAPIGSVTGAISGNVLVGTTTSYSVTAVNSGHGDLAAPLNVNLNGSVYNLNGKFGSLSNLSGGNGSFSLTDGASKTETYSFAPTVKGETVTGPLNTTFSNGSPNGANAGFTAATQVNLTGVAAVNQVASDAAALARFNAYGSAGANATTSGSTGVTVTNTGNGDLADASMGAQRNLNGSFGSASSSVFSGPIKNGSFSLQDSTATKNNSADVTYAFDPTARGVVTSTVTGLFSNGSSDGKNTAQTVTETVSGTGVGATYSSAVGATQAAAKASLAASNTNTPVANTGVSTINFGTISSNTTETLYLALGNTSTDANGGNALLTDLSLESASITGSSFFTIPTVSAIIDQGGEYFAPITFDTSHATGSFSAVLTFQTDASAGFGAAGDTFSYDLVGKAVPELSSWAMMLAGFACLGFVAYRRDRGAAFSA